MNANMYEAFGDELTKIALLKTIGSGFKSALREGWGPAKGGVLGKALTVGQTALMLPQVMNPVDQSGRGRSSTERGADLIGNTVGGLAGAGAGSLLANRLFKGNKRLGLINTAMGMAGGIGGSILGGKALTAPWQDSRRSLVNHMNAGAVDPNVINPQRAV